ncbi:MAG: undecaprenyl-diphosphate phosphatase [Treponema sp.]|jgi:undecaprenyl-diphosphatase|nr:undecaprenyl-diphosphate phosphatase [Treponema sp.]
MSIIEAIILGAVQGLTEFLPVSSSGHLALLQKLFGISEGALLFDILVHVGTLFAVFVVLWDDIWELLRKPIQAKTGFLIIATIPTVIVALFFKDLIESAFASAQFLGFAFLLTGTALFVSERLSRRSGVIREYMGIPDVLIIGIMQAIAIIPGVSRSGFTLAGALSRKVERGIAARFSFLLSIPAILGALVLQLKDVISGEASGSPDAAPLIAGVLTAGIVGFFSVKLMLKIVKEHSLIGFAVYVVCLGILILADQYVSHFFFTV